MRAGRGGSRRAAVRRRAERARGVVVRHAHVWRAARVHGVATVGAARRHGRGRAGVVPAERRQRCVRRGRGRGHGYAGRARASEAISRRKLATTLTCEIREGSTNKQTKAGCQPPALCSGRVWASRLLLTSSCRRYRPVLQHYDHAALRRLRERACKDQDAVVVRPHGPPCVAKRASP